jgi:hypothetical protein
MKEEQGEMNTMHDDWTEIIKLAQALMPERPTSALNHHICREGERGGQERRDNKLSSK